MKRFMELTALIEPVLKKSEALFSEGNQLDLTIGGEDWEIEDILFVLESYVARKSIKPGEIITPQSMKDFLEKIWDALWMMSDLRESELEKWLILNGNTAFIKMKLEDRNYSKQLCILKIMNEICQQAYGFNLLVGL